MDKAKLLELIIRRVAADKEKRERREKQAENIVALQQQGLSLACISELMCMQESMVRAIRNCDDSRD